MKHEWQSLTFGNVVVGFGEVLKQVWESWTRFKVLDIRWKRGNRYVLPTEIWAATTYISDEWCLLDKWNKKVAISDYLSDKYGFCHKGFTYEEANHVVHITNIEWDTDSN